MTKTLEHTSYFSSHFYLSREQREEQLGFFQLPAEERQRIIEENHEVALSANVFVDHSVVLFETLSGESRERIFSDDLLSKTRFAEERIETRESLLEYEKSHPEITELIDEAQRIIETLPLEIKQNMKIRDHLEVVETDEEYMEKMGPTEHPWACCENRKRRIILNLGAKKEKKDQVILAKTEEKQGFIDNLYSLLHESCHLLSCAPFEKTFDQFIDKTGFNIYQIDPVTFHLNSDKNRNLNEIVTLFLALQLMKKSNYEQDIDWEQMKQSKIHSYPPKAVGFIVDAIGMDVLMKNYFEADYESFYLNVKKASRKRRNEKTHLLRKIFNILSEDKI